MLAYFACTLAYQRSVEQALREVGLPAGDVRADDIKREMKDAYKALEPTSFHDLSLDSATEHAFVRQSDGFFEIFARSAGYDDVQRRKLLNAIRGSFTENLKTLLSHGDTRERFAPVDTLLRLNTAERQAYDALDLHAEFQQWLYSEAPTLGGEAFALGHVYVETDCGHLAWGEIRSARESAVGRTAAARAPVDPFDETSSPRTPALQAIMELLGNPDFDDAVVVQGVAGSGKSALTLRLCAELLKEGLRPIRVRMRDLRFDLHANEALPAAVMLGPATGDAQRPKNLFLGGRIFDQRVRFRDAEICPFVLIFDGWDEISISTKEGFEYRLERLLEQVRNQYLGTPRGHRLRVIITGRPTASLDRSTFLRDSTAILTLRSLTPVQVEAFVGSLVNALRTRPLVPGSGVNTSIPDLAHFRKVLDRYAKDFEAAREREKKQPQRSNTEEGSSMEVLGHPLLAQIAVRLMAQWGGDLERLIDTPTTLYRSLVDLTCVKGGQIEQEPLDLGDRHRIRGNELRDLLRRTALAMTAFGVESINHDELEERLGLASGELTKRADDAAADRALSALLISFYFRGGLTHLGCEFLHKSFREYLFAEAIVEELKRYGRETEPSRDADASLSRRKPYWKDFDSNDPRYRLSRALGPALASQWMSREVAAHVRELLTWEIDRASGRAPGTKQGQPTTRLPLEGWERVRDGLADLWDWWGEGVHLRPQPFWDNKNLEAHRSYVELLVKDAFPKESQRPDLPAPRRTVTADARLGDGLFRLTAIVHRHIAEVTGWPVRGAGAEERWKGVDDNPVTTRPYQSSIVEEGRRWVFFAPTGKDRQYFQNYCARINAAGWRPGGMFPGGIDGGSLDWRGITVLGTMGLTNLSLANLSNASFAAAYLGRAEMNDVRGSCIFVEESMLGRANLCRAALDGAIFLHSNCQRASFREADLRQAHFLECDLRGASFVGANLKNARFDGCLLDGADFEGADVSNLHVFDCDLTKTKLGAKQRAAIEQANAWLDDTDGKSP